MWQTANMTIKSWRFANIELSKPSLMLCRYYQKSRIKMISMTGMTGTTHGYDRYNICLFPNPAVVALMLNFKFNLCLCTEKRRSSNHCISKGSRWDRLCRPCSSASGGQRICENWKRVCDFYNCWGFIFVGYNSCFLLFSRTQAHIFQVL